MSYEFQKKDGNSDYTKRQILLIQESYKLFLPLGAGLVSALLALNIANAIKNFMALYFILPINAVGLFVAVMIVLRLIRGNLRQQFLFEQLSVKETGEKIFVADYVSDTNEVLKGAQRVSVYESDNAYTVLPQLNEYKPALFTEYDFKSDFGRLIFDKEQCGITLSGGELRLRSDGEEFVFAIITASGDNAASGQDK